MTVEQIRQKFLSNEPGLSWVWEILEGKRLPETERIASLPRKQLCEIQDTIKAIRAADRTDSPMALLAVEQLTEKLLSGESVRPDKYYCSNATRGKRNAAAAGITMLLFIVFLIAAFTGVMRWNAYVGFTCFIIGIAVLMVGSSISNRLYRQDAPQHLAETDYHTDRLYFLRGECFLLSDKLLFSYYKNDRVPARYRDQGPESPDHLCVPISDISYIQGQMLILSNGGAISLYDSPQLADMLEYISALVRWAPAPYHPSKDSENSYIKTDKNAMLKLIIAVVVLVIGVYSMPSFVNIVQMWFAR